MSDGKANKKKDVKGPLSSMWSVVTWFFVIVCVLLAVLLVGVRVIGFRPYAVLSPSMTPKYGVGDLVYVKAMDPEKIEVGDVLTFVANEDLTVVTHRVVEIDRENRCFYTKGDANEIQDGNPVLYENAIGVVQFSLPKLGYVSSYLTSPSGRYVGIAAGAFLVLLLIIPEFFKNEKKKDDFVEK